MQIEDEPASFEQTLGRALFAFDGEHGQHSVLVDEHSDRLYEVWVYVVLNRVDDPTEVTMEAIVSRRRDEAAWSICFRTWHNRELLFNIVLNHMNNLVERTDRAYLLRIYEDRPEARNIARQSAHQ